MPGVSTSYVASEIIFCLSETLRACVAWARCEAASAQAPNNNIDINKKKTAQLHPTDAVTPSGRAAPPVRPYRHCRTDCLHLVREASYTTGCCSGDRWLDRGGLSRHPVEALYSFFTMLPCTKTLALSRWQEVISVHRNATRYVKGRSWYPSVAHGMLIEGSREC